MADRFYRRVDELLGDYLDAGFVVGLTADHGMNAKHNHDGSPRVSTWKTCSPRSGHATCQVVLPITDPYVVHHGALGSFAWVHLPQEQVERARAAFAALDGVEEVYTRDEAAVDLRAPRRPHRRPLRRLRCAHRARQVGRQARPHRWSRSGLRSHGGRHEQIVPIIVSEPLREPYAAATGPGCAAWTCTTWC